MAPGGGWFTALMAQADADNELDWVVSVDSTIVRAHQHSVGARRKGAQLPSRATTPSAGRAGDLQRRSILLSTAAVGPSRSS